MKKILSFFAITALLVQHGVSAENEKPLIFVPVSPYEYVFEKIGGDLIEVESIAGPNDDAHTYSPTPKQIAKMSNANVLCSGELGFEANYFVKFGDGDDAPKSLNLLEGLDLLEGHCDHPSHDEEHAEHHEEEEGEHHEDEDEHHHHDHEDLNDPHVWLSPSMLKKISDRVASVLKDLVPADKAAEIDSNLAAFKKELEAVDAELRESLADHKGKKFYVYHGAFAYFARDYGLEQIAVEIANRQPTPKHIADLAKQAKADGVKTIFVQPQFDQSSGKSLAETIGGEVAALNPLEKDILANLKAIAAALTK